MTQCVVNTNMHTCMYVHICKLKEKQVINLRGIRGTQEELGNWRRRGRDGVDAMRMYEVLKRKSNDSFSL